VDSSLEALGVPLHATDIPSNGGAGAASGGTAWSWVGGRRYLQNSHRSSWVRVGELHQIDWIGGSSMRGQAIDQAIGQASAAGAVGLGHEFSSPPMGLRLLRSALLRSAPPLGGSSNANTIGSSNANTIPTTALCKHADVETDGASTGHVAGHVAGQEDSDSFIVLVSRDQRGASTKVHGRRTMADEPAVVKELREVATRR
jgi:hypothetical protein